jgi:hypothetical protein
VRISQNGNTANNGFHNALILGDSPQIEIVGRTSTAGIRHAFSQPAWDIFQNKIPKSSTFPRWTGQQRKVNKLVTTSTLFPNSLITSHNSRLDTNSYNRLVEESNGSFAPDSDLNQLIDIDQLANQVQTFGSKFSRFAHNIVSQIRVLQVRPYLGVRSKVFENSRSEIHITIGNSIPRISPVQSAITQSIVMEHGQVRWIYDGSSDESFSRDEFKSLCLNAKHIWITNVDERTLNIAEELFHERWSVLPHPYVLDQQAPYDVSSSPRLEICHDLKADFLLFSASSLSIDGDQKKGTPKLLKAVHELKNTHGISIGLVLVNWGNDAPAIYALIRSLGISDQCRFVQPMPRIALQKFMGHFDLVADQFDHDAFGALTIRALEQGVPLLSRRIGDLASEYIGRRPPVLHASNEDEIVLQIRYCIEKQSNMGRDSYLQEFRSQARNWVTERHHHSFTRVLQEERYMQLMSSEIVNAIPGRWGQIPDWHQ